MKSQLSWVCLALGASLSTGCVVSDDRGRSSGRSSSPVYDSGSVSVDWTIDGTADPSQCTQSNVDYVHIQLDDDSGLFDEDEAPCEDFDYVFDNLPPGYYSVTLQMFDSRDRERTTAVSSDPYDIDDDSVHIPTDFPIDSFY